MKRFDDARVAAVFKAYPPAVRTRLMALREMMFDVAAATPGVGKLTETLKWGQPSYSTEETGSRLHRAHRSAEGRRRAATPSTSIARAAWSASSAELYPDTFAATKASGRSHFEARGSRLPARELRHCIALALTHHLRKKRQVTHGSEAACRTS